MPTREAMSSGNIYCKSRQILMKMSTIKIIIDFFLLPGGKSAIQSLQMVQPTSMSTSFPRLLYLLQILL